MTSQPKVIAIGAVVGVLCGLLSFGFMQRIVAQSADGNRSNGLPRAADGKPDLSGVWQTLNTANWDLLDHSARQGPVALGAFFSVPGGQGVVDGNEIPYRSDAISGRQERATQWLTADPELKCYMPGVPRATYMPYPFQIVQTSSDIFISYQFAGASRIVRMNSKDESPAPSWMGWSRGSWDGDSLLIDVTDFNDQTWFDRSGNFHSDALHVIERYTLLDADHIRYEATIEDPKVFTRPWKISMPLYRRIDKDARVMEYKCVEFVEELMYGALSSAESR